MKYLLTTCLFTFLVLTSCEKDEGEGGQATLKGKVVFREVYSNPLLGIKDSIIDVPYADEDVYLSYGDNDIYDDDFKTDYKGEYKFEGLRKGSYTVYSLSNCKECRVETNPISQTITISDGKGVTEVPTIYIYKNNSN